VLRQAICSTTRGLGMEMGMELGMGQNKYEFSAHFTGVINVQETPKSTTFTRAGKKQRHHHEIEINYMSTT